MRRPTLSLLALALALAAVADAAPPGPTNYNPRIAWTAIEGKGQTIYLANADGSAKFAVYKTNKTSLYGLDLANGRVAFVEQGVLKVLHYTVTSGGIVASAPVTLDATGAPDQGARTPDFSPDGSYVLYGRWVQDPVGGGGGEREIRVIPSNGSAPPKVLLTAADLPDTRHIGAMRWVSGSEFMFNREGGSPWWMSMMLGSLDANMDLTAPPLTLFTNTDPGWTAVGVNGWEDFDISRTGPSVLVSANAPSGNLHSFVQYDYINHTFTKRFSTYGWRGHFQAGDASVVYSNLGSGGIVWGNAVYRWDAATNKAASISGKAGQTIGYVDAIP